MRNLIGFLKGAGTTPRKGQSLALVYLLLAACAVGPDYRVPQVAMPDAFAAVDGVAASGAEVEREFWKSFNDPLLDDLVERALSVNHDIRIAQAPA
jgi:outer membrane protein TolC